MSKDDTANPFNKIPKKTTQQISRKEFTKDQAIKILGAFSDTGLYLLHKEEMEVLFNIGAWTGLRLRDCVMLSWKDVNLKENILRIVPSKTSRTNKLVTIPIHPKLSRQLQEASSWQTDDIVLPKVSERYLRNPSGITKDCIKVMKHVGIEDDSAKQKGRARSANLYGFHSFRHSFVSFCAEAGVPMATVQAIVGHGSPAMTRHYTHIGIDTLKSAVNKLAISSDNKEPDIRDKINRLLDTLPENKLVEVYELLGST